MLLKPLTTPLSLILFVFKFKVKVVKTLPTCHMMLCHQYQDLNLFVRGLTTKRVNMMRKDPKDACNRDLVINEDNYDY